eukprot:CAMPEP_0206139412 /NCGR_PEP_ID=MMETSP1473-20131121/5911_1 /ASSEMBLY_ACC=CAM_ASM_001109 /TAXON_ID=1461547 /ORGANISM="Stichococcus sp, Strain RCC1054" /LENGTH=212 /DNA_ID=CAMNT_0053533197 /DNA_START=203 /DNA_END=842 /DNA_ORIENTATION=+
MRQFPAVRHQRAIRTRSSGAGIGAGAHEDPHNRPDVSHKPSDPPGQPATDGSGSNVQSTSPWAKLKRFFGGDKLDRERLKALGVGAVLSYGVVSNVTYGGGMAVAWIAFVKQRGLSPLMPGQWKAFLAFYAGFWTIQNFIRPFRFALAVSMAPVFDKLVNAVQRSLGGSRQKAFAACIALLGVVTSVLVFGSIYIFAGPLALREQRQACEEN